VSVTLSQKPKNRIALAPPFPHNPPMLARVLSAAVHGIEAFPVEVEVNCGWGDTIIVIVEAIPPNTPFCSKWHQSQQVRMQKAFASRNSTSRVPVLVFAYSAR